MTRKVEYLFQYKNDVATWLLHRPVLIRKTQRLKEGRRQLEALSITFEVSNLSTGMNPPLESTHVHSTLNFPPQFP